MAMEISKTFVVRAPVDAAWTFLTDPARVAACLPGAAITSQLDDNSYQGTVTIKVGPVAASYKGTMRFARLDAAAHTAEITASGRDTRGKGGADMTMTSRLVERGQAETEVSVVSQVNVMGVLAQFGRGMILDVGDELFQRFVDAMRARLEVAGAGDTGAKPSVAGPAAGMTEPAGARAPVAAASPESRSAVPPSPSEVAPRTAPSFAPAEPSAPIEVLSFGSSILGRALARAIRRPAVWVAALIVILAAAWLLLRR